MSATERKFGYVKVLNEMGISHFPTEDDTNETSTLLIRTAMLPALVESMPCKSCRQCSVNIRVVNCELGMVCCLECVCTSCGEVNGSTKTSETIGDSKSHVVVRSAVSATMDMAVGHAGLVKFCRYMDMPVMHHSTYHSNVKIITAASMQVANDVICEAAETVRCVHRELDPSIDTSDFIDLTVSFDGSWMTRGHKSLYGIGCVVEVVTGLVIDFAIVSLYCHMCACAAGTALTRTATSITLVILVQWRWKQPRSCGHAPWRSTTSDTRLCSPTVTLVRTSACATWMCTMASQSQKKNA